jgi:antitoxin component of MazEF toxin-antitoxin module
MAALRLKLAKIGNSRGVRLPAGLIRRYGLSHGIEAETTKEGILLKPGRSHVGKLSWGDAAKAMVRSTEDWSDWDATAADGLKHL